MALAIGLGAFVLFAMGGLVLWNLMGNLDLERRERSEAPSPELPAPTIPRTNGHCVLCEQPLRRLATPDEVISAIERYIGDESDRVEQILRRPESDNFQRLYLA